VLQAAAPRLCVAALLGVVVAALLFVAPGEPAGKRGPAGVSFAPELLVTEQWTVPGCSEAVQRLAAAAPQPVVPVWKTAVALAETAEAVETAVGTAATEAEAQAVPVSGVAAAAAHAIAVGTVALQCGLSLAQWPRPVLLVVALWIVGAWQLCNNRLLLHWSLLYQ